MWTEHPTTLPACCSNKEEDERSCAEGKTIPKKSLSSLHAARVTSISSSIETDLVASKENWERPGSTTVIFCWKLVIKECTWSGSDDSDKNSRAALHASEYCSLWRYRWTVERQPSLLTITRWGVVCCGESSRFGFAIGSHVVNNSSPSRHVLFYRRCYSPRNQCQENARRWTSHRRQVRSPDSGAAAAALRRKDKLEKGGK